MPSRLWLRAVLVVLVAAPAGAQTVTVPKVDEATFNYAVTEERRNIFAANLALDPGERARFWDVYEDYAKERVPLDKERFSLLSRYAQSYAALNDEQAMAIVIASGRLQISELELRLKYTGVLRKRMSGRVAARFFQIDDYVTTAMRMNSLGGVPLVLPPGR